VILVAFLAGCSSPIKAAHDPLALNSIDSMGITIDNLTSCIFSFSMNISHKDSGKIKWKKEQSDVYMRGPDKMYVYTADETSRKAYYYNVSDLALFYFDDLKYEVIKSPSNTMVTIDSIHRTFGIVFPTSDLFYPTLADDMMNDFDTIFVSGSTDIDEVTCKEINAVTAKMTVFVSNDELAHLPKRLEIYYLGDKKGDSYSISEN
jgi:hypothetical protein